MCLLWLQANPMFEDRARTVLSMVVTTILGWRESAVRGCGVDVAWRGIGAAVARIFSRTPCNAKKDVVLSVTNRLTV